MTVLFSGEVWLSYGQAYLFSADLPADLLECFGGQSNGLCGAAVAGMLHLRTGLHTGVEPFTVELLDHAPPPPAAQVDDEGGREEWEEVVEVSFHTDTPTLQLSGCISNDSHTIALGAPGRFRVRYSARGLDAADAMDTRGADEPAPDAYLLQLWAAPPDDRGVDEVLRQTSEHAGYWHRAARALPIPPSPAERAAALARAEARARELNLIRQQQLDIEHNWGGREPTPRLRALGHIAQLLARTDRDLLDQLAELDPDTQRGAARWLARRAFEVAGLDTLDWARAGLDALDAGRPLPRPFVDLAEAFALVPPSGTAVPAAASTAAPIAGLATGTLGPAAGVLGPPSPAPSMPGAGLLESLRAALPAIPASAPVQPPIAAHTQSPMSSQPPIPAAFPAVPASGPQPPTLGESAIDASEAPPRSVHRPSMAIPALPAATAADPLHALLDTLSHAGAAFHEQRPQLLDELRTRYP